MAGVLYVMLQASPSLSEKKTWQKERDKQGQKERGGCKEFTNASTNWANGKLKYILVWFIDAADLRH